MVRSDPVIVAETAGTDNPIRTIANCQKTRPSGFRIFHGSYAVGVSRVAVDPRSNQIIAKSCRPLILGTKE